MLHIVFLIIKIILLILAAVLGLVLLLLLVLLFVPIRYRVQGAKTAEDFFAEGKASWLLHLVSVPFSFRDGRFQAAVKIFGFPVKRIPAEEKSGDPEEEEITGTEYAGPEEEEITGTEYAGPDAELPTPETTPGSQRETPEQEKIPEAPQKAGSRRKGSVPGGIAGKLRNLKCTIRNICDTIRQAAVKFRETRELVMDAQTKAALANVWKQLKHLLLHILPRKLRGALHFGTSDPAQTGQILGAVSIFYPLFKDNVRVTPDFEQEILEGELYAKGHIRLSCVALAALKLICDRNVRVTYRRFKNRSK